MLRIGDHERSAMDGTSVHITHPPKAHSSSQKSRENLRGGDERECYCLVPEHDMAMAYTQHFSCTHTHDFHKTKEREKFEDRVEKGSRCPNPS